MNLIGSLVAVLSKFIGVLALPGLVLIAEVLVEVLPASIEWGVVRTAFALLQNEWRYEKVRELVVMQKPAAGVKA